ncbi:hypothetical protein G6F35_017005 [Rhizopus arrhizus]|nr:hypothetical protein G6F35_017005 [Rhizopus arrhizus]
MAQVNSSDVLVDLGSGDGRFVTAAVSEFDVSRAVGIESDKALVETSNTLRFTEFTNRYTVDSDCVILVA